MKTACFVILDGRRNMICLPCVQCIVWPLLGDLPSFSDFSLHAIYPPPGQAIPLVNSFLTSKPGKGFIVLTSCLRSVLVQSAMSAQKSTVRTVFLTPFRAVSSIFSSCGNIFFDSSHQSFQVMSSALVAAIKS